MNKIFNQHDSPIEQTFYYPEDLVFDTKTQSFLKSTSQQHDFDKPNTNEKTQASNMSPNTTFATPFSALLNGKNDMLTSLLAGNLFGTNSPKNEYLSQALNLLNSQKTKSKDSEASSLTINNEDVSQSFEEK